MDIINGNFQTFPVVQAAVVKDNVQTNLPGMIVVGVMLVVSGEKRPVVLAMHPGTAAEMILAFEHSAQANGLAAGFLAERDQAKAWGKQVEKEFGDADTTG